MCFDGSQPPTTSPKMRYTDPNLKHAVFATLQPRYGVFTYKMRDCATQ